MKELNNQGCDEATESCCNVDAVVTIDDRGQMVLPKELRYKLGVAEGGKLAVVSWEKSGELCCVSLLPTAGLGGMVRTLLEPIIRQTTS